MSGERRLLVLPGGILSAAVLGGSGVVLVGASLTGSMLVRGALGVCGVAFLLAAAAYAWDGYGVQAGTHALVGVGFGAVAGVPEGIVALVGLCCLSSGGLLLVRDARSRRTPRTRERTGPSRR